MAPARPRRRALREARRGEPGTDTRLAAGLDFIASHFDDPFLGVRDVAAVMGTNVRQAARLFLPTGRTIREHVEEKRLERLRHLLETTALPLAAIAERCGFASRQYLSLVFRRRTSQTPGEWRQKTMKPSKTRHSSFFAPAMRL